MTAHEPTSLQQISKDVNRISEAFERHAEQDHTSFEAIHSTLAEISHTLADLSTTMREQKETLSPIADAYSGFLFSRSFITGVASVVLAIGAIGAGVIWLINAALHK